MNNLGMYWRSWQLVYVQSEQIFFFFSLLALLYGKINKVFEKILFWIGVAVSCSSRVEMALVWV